MLSDTIINFLGSSLEYIFQFLPRLYRQLRTELVSTHALIPGKMIPNRLLKHEEAKRSHSPFVLCSLLYPGLLLLRSQQKCSALPPQPGSNKTATVVVRMALPTSPPTAAVELQPNRMASPFQGF